MSTGSPTWSQLGPGRPPKSDHRAQILQGSLARLILVADEAGAELYRRLFERYPELRPLFPSDLQAGQDKFMLALAAFAENAGSPANLERKVRNLSRRNREYGFRREFCQPVGTLFLEIMAEYIQASAEELAAWSEAYQQIVALMVPEFD